MRVPLISIKSAPLSRNAWTLLLWLMRADDEDSASYELVERCSNDELASVYAAMAQFREERHLRGGEP